MFCDFLLYCTFHNTATKLFVTYRLTFSCLSDLQFTAYINNPKLILQIGREGFLGIPLDPDQLVSRLFQRPEQDAVRVNQVLAQAGVRWRSNQGRCLRKYQGKRRCLENIPIVEDFVEDELKSQLY